MAKDIKQKIKEIKAIIEVATLALPKERDAQRHYRNAARNAPGELSKRIFEELAEEEANHEKKLKAMMTILEDELERLK
jgi:rubrerythrin